MPHYLQLLLLAWLIAAVVMLLMWFRYFATKNPIVVDLGWTISLVLAATLYFFMGNGDFMRKILITAMVVFWGLRLSIHLLIDRILPNIEDGRYTQLKNLWSKNTDPFFFGFFQLQAFVVAILSIPFLVVALNPSPIMGTWEWMGLLVFGIALGGEATADQQLREFKKSPQNKGKTCRTGLWKYSRHPNYFCEWLIWVAYALVALSSPFGYLAIVSPALMFHFIVNVTGIPPTEEQALRSRGEDYKKYQHSTSAFIPWFPRRV